MARPKIKPSLRKSEVLSFRVRKRDAGKIKRAVEVTIREISFQGNKKNIIDEKLDKTFKKQEERRKKK